MKRTLIVVFSGLIVAGSLSAQSAGQPLGRGGMPAMSFGSAPVLQEQTAETVKIEGKLSFINGRIAVQTGGKTYYIQRIDRLIGFVDGLKEGASVKLEGFAIPISMAPEYVVLRVTKLTFGGKEYDLSSVNGPGMTRQGLRKGYR
jgi:hypothetical protein